MHELMHARTSTNTRAHTRTHMHTRAYKPTHTHTCTHVHTHAHTHARTHARIHTHMHKELSSLLCFHTRTNGCLRNDKSTCFKPDSPYHQITHNGLDAMVDRFIDTYEAFGNLPAELAYANHTLCVARGEGEWSQRGLGGWTREGEGRTSISPV
jgi:hypothetical protein